MEALLQLHEWSSRFVCGPVAGHHLDVHLLDVRIEEGRLHVQLVDFPVHILRCSEHGADALKSAHRSEGATAVPARHLTPALAPASRSP